MSERARRDRARLRDPVALRAAYPRAQLGEEMRIGPQIAAWVKGYRANGLPAEGSRTWQKSVVRVGSDERTVLAQ